MASTAHQTDEEKQEFFDSPEDLDVKALRLAQLIESSKHFIAFTGAGISTSAGVPDFRSGINTVLQTGPGAWEKLAQGTKDKGTYKRTSMLQAVPTKTHMALLKLQQAGYLKHLISQNVDGLHRRSGFPADKLSELHGNTNLEICKKKGCGKQYMRDYSCRTAREVHDHVTGRKCVCGGDLHDSIINFGENLPDKALDDGFFHSENADLCLVLGSSLRVTPAANMPALVGKQKKELVICNIQKTPLDKLSKLRIYSFCDELMVKVCAHLGLQIEEFRLERRFQIIKESATKVQIRGIDLDSVPFTLFRSVEIEVSKGEKYTSVKEPHNFVLTKQAEKLSLTLEFLGHYNEPKFQQMFDLSQNQGISTFQLSINPMKEG